MEIDKETQGLLKASQHYTKAIIGEDVLNIQRKEVADLIRTKIDELNELIEKAQFFDLRISISQPLFDGKKVSVYITHNIKY